MDQIEKLKSLRDEARARVEATGKQLENSVDGQLVASIDCIIQELESADKQAEFSPIATGPEGGEYEGSMQAMIDDLQRADQERSIRVLKQITFDGQLNELDSISFLESSLRELLSDPYLAVISVTSGSIDLIVDIAHSNAQSFQEQFESGAIAVICGFRLLFFGPVKNASKPVVFISYKRTDTGLVVGFVRDFLQKKLGKSAVFLDVENIQPGEEFGKVILQALQHARVVIALIGQNWAPPSEWVTKEIEQALTTNIIIIPTLTGHGTSMPAQESLPHKIHDLCSYQAFELDPVRSFTADMEKLTVLIRENIELPAADS